MAVHKLAIMVCHNVPSSGKFRFDGTYHFRVITDDAIGAPITPVEHDIVLELWVVLGRSSDAMRNFFCVGVRTFLCNRESKE